MNRIEGADSLERKIRQLQQAAMGVNMQPATNRGLKIIQAEAKLLCPANHGELRNDIKTMTQATGDGVDGTCYVNKSYASYVELGTGPEGQANHSGVSPAVIPVYSQSGWWIHESQIDKGDAERYHMFAIETEDGTFYHTNGQPAQPFMYPAIKNNERRVVKTIKDQISEDIKEVCSSD